MQYFYDGQIRRYVGQLIRMLSGFKYETEDGKQITVPVMYGDMTRQVASIIRENSENKIPSAPRIAVHLQGLLLINHVLAIRLLCQKFILENAQKFTTVTAM